MTVVVYTDGSGRGGWGWTVSSAPDEYTGPMEGSDGISRPLDSSKAELFAVCHAVEQITWPLIHVMSDSLYIVNSIPENRIHDGMSNFMLWRFLDDHMEHKHVTFSHVKGHNGNPYNERADQLAKAGAGGRSRSLSFRKYVHSDEHWRRIEGGGPFYIGRPDEDAKTIARREMFAEMQARKPQRRKLRQGGEIPPF